MNDIKQETTKQALSQITQTNPMMALLLVAVMSGAGGMGGASLFGGNDQTMNRINELEKTQVAHGAALKTMEGQQTKIDKTLDSLTTAINELNRSVAVMNATMEKAKRG
ncbi:hypothetical protein [Aeromonas veronii]|uniref:hypothetical protein n=1 Tax=Aeromonas veronii TaxID=654 RepID=UPI003D24340E